MKVALIVAALSCCAATLTAQTLDRVYNRDTEESFKLKSVTNDTTVMGPIVKQKTVFAFENPYKKLTEASVWFSLDWAAVLSGFAYWYKYEYVPGILMDKQKAWFIYTAITSRNEDPGIMVQTSPSSYHAQIYPLAVGHDLRVELTSVGFLRPETTGLKVPAPSKTDEVPYEMHVKSYRPDTVAEQNDGYVVDYPRKTPLDMQLYAQRHKDGWVYVAGLVRRDSVEQAINLKGLKNVFWSQPMEGDQAARWFIGRRKGPGTVSVSTKGGSDVQKVHANDRGSDTSKLWAHQALMQRDWRSNRDVLRFSMKYGIPSAQTALLAVPQEQMKLFKKKEAEFRRKQAEQARRDRAWQNNRSQNWRNNNGGDPEIRVTLPGAVRAFAVLPDGRRIDLRPSGNDVWGGSYDIPVLAPEGEYVIKIVGIRQDGSEFTSTTSYEIDRTKPVGSYEIINGWLIVKSEPKLTRIIAVMKDGDEIPMKETEPGVYKVELNSRKPMSVILYDANHNRGVVEIR